ncbi:hypothetical protein F9L33_09495 [Amylibacter sp. SFDW26]|uniref:FliM/FliN family flagellar motor switch protein n=1 Tax=Amylibacter sp. SFDW26 TaxID=2652722 RepID=UPI0012625DA9|nr:FliM/FliN family flagellar motor switch protein [Amylibacter sp. SFDW26]KAB7613604.1 hypothetical protein F9L33_09495 [Amylibacter sp. SFDW26]
MLDASKLAKSSAAPLILTAKELVVGSQALINNKITHCLPDVEFIFATRSVKLQLYQSSAENETKVWDQFILKTETLSFSVFLGADLLPTVLENDGYETTADEFRNETYHIIYEHYLSSLLTKLNGTIEETVQLVDIIKDAEPPETKNGIWLALKSSLFHGGSAAFVIAGPQSDLDHILTVFESFTGDTKTPNLGNVPQILSRRSPSFDFNFKDLLPLKVGDVIMFDKRWEGHKDCIIWLNESHQAKVEFTYSDEFEIQSDFQPVLATAQKPEGKSDMDNKTTELVSFDDLPVSLSIEFDRIVKPLSEIQELREGAILPFQSTEPETVSLMANGKSLAEGVLVRVDGQIGIRITRMA